MRFRGIRSAALVTMVGLLGIAGCSSSARHGADHHDVHAVFRVTPKTAVADTPVSVTIDGLPAGRTVTVTATAEAKVRWSASAKFAVPPDGTVSLRTRPEGGSYTGADPMGLFEYMAPPKGSSEEVFRPFFAGKPFDVKLQAKVNHRVVGTTTVRRLATAPGVTHRKLRPASDGVYGELFLPPGTSGHHPAVLLFGGSEGGLSTAVEAGRIAGHGYPVLALAYFGEPGLPDQLREIPLEYFVKALHILRDQHGVDPQHVLTMGISRGAEAALLLGAHFPKLVDGVIAGSPSSVVNGSVGSWTATAWTLHGKPLPFVPQAKYAEPDASGISAAEIPVEKIHGPVMVVCGTADLVWPSCGYQDAIVTRLRAHHFTHPVTDLRLKGAGHFAGSMSAYYSATRSYYFHRHGKYPAAGGLLQGNKQGEARARRALLHFLAGQR